MRISERTKFTTIKYIIILIVILFAVLFIKPVSAESPTIEIVKQYPDHITEQKQYAYDAVLNEWGVEEWNHFNDLIQRESEWYNYAQNPKSTAYGYGQFLNSTWGLVGCSKTSDPNIQIDCTVKYIKVVYKTPQKAIAFHNANNYY
jgi:hypothetical protein